MRMVTIGAAGEDGGASDMGLYQRGTCTRASGGTSVEGSTENGDNVSGSELFQGGRLFHVTNPQERPLTLLIPPLIMRGRANRPSS